MSLLRLSTPQFHNSTTPKEPRTPKTSNSENSQAKTQNSAHPFKTPQGRSSWELSSLAVASWECIGSCVLGVYWELWSCVVGSCGVVELGVVELCSWELTAKRRRPQRFERMMEPLKVVRSSTA